MAAGLSPLVPSLGQPFDYLLSLLTSSKMQHASSILLPRVSRGLQRGREAQLVPLFCCILAALLLHASAHHIGRPVGQSRPPAAANCTRTALSPTPSASCHASSQGTLPGARSCWRLPLFQPPVLAPQPPTGPVERSLKRQHTRVSRRGAVRWSLAGASSPPLGSPTTIEDRASIEHERGVWGGMLSRVLVGSQVAAWGL